jgi:hypothetical protein
MVAMAIRMQPHSQKNPIGRSSRKLLASWRMFAFAPAPPRRDPASRGWWARHPSAPPPSLGHSHRGTKPGAASTRATELLLTFAEQINREIADEAILAELPELRDLASSALRQLSER